MDVSVDKCLVPFGLAGLLHRFRPTLALVTAFVKEVTWFQEESSGLSLVNHPVAIPAVREEVYFDISAPGPSVRPQRELYSLKHVDN